MKRFLYLIAAAAFALVACEQPEAPKPDVDGPEDGVETKLVLSVSTGTPETRMTADAAQRNDNFLGITQARMLSFACGWLGGDETPTSVVKTDGSGWLRTFDLGTLYTADKIQGNTQNQASRSNRILKLMLPREVNSVVIYGKAINPAPGKAQGKTDAHLSDTLDNIFFHAERRIGDSTKVKNYDATARLMVACVNFLLSSEVGPQAEEYKGYTNLPALSVKELGHIYAWTNLHDNEFNHEPYISKMRELKNLEQSLGAAYYAFAKVNEKSYRAGSSHSILTIANAMVSMMAANNNNEAVDANMANALRLGDEIERRVSLLFNITMSNPDDPTTAVVTSFKSENIIRANLGISSNTLYDGAADLDGFPYEDFGIPEGAAQFCYTHVALPDYPTGPVEADSFYYLHPNAPLVNQNMDSFDPRKYVYPAELMYFCNSGLRVSKNEIADSAYPDGVTNWETASSWTGFTNHGTVDPDTKSVAVRDNINYGVALLETYVKWANDNDQIELEDNRAEVMGVDAATGNKHFVANTTQFYLTGVLIGGVNPAYDWQYLPTQRFINHHHEISDAPCGPFDGVIYDDAIAGASTITNRPGVKGRELPITENPNCTIVYDNYNVAKDKAHQDSVYVTLEFVNMGEEFYGKNGLIPTGGRFYLVGKLEPDPTKFPTNNWPANYQVPPVYGIQGDTESYTLAERGQSKRIPRVFIQNFVTTANFYIGNKSLQKAFYTIPDLKSAQLSLGLSVDLKWLNGYSFNVEEYY